MTARKNELIKNFDHLETLKFSHATVKGFTEQGLYMLATILKQVLPLQPVLEPHAKVQSTYS